MTAFKPSSGSIEAIKWLALAAMVVDHVAAVFYDRDVPLWAEVVGRLAFPMFAIVIGYNLSRLGADLGRALNRLALFGLLALPFHAYLFSILDGWWPLNVMFTFAVAVAVVQALQLNRPAVALAVFVVGGALVEYWWPGVALVVVTWMAAGSKRPSRYAVPAVITLAALCVVNGNLWALGALPLVVVLVQVAPYVRRSRWAFYVVYPVHLALFAGMTFLSNSSYN